MKTTGDTKFGYKPSTAIKVMMHLIKNKITCRFLFNTKRLPRNWARTDPRDHDHWSYFSAVVWVIFLFKKFFKLHFLRFFFPVFALKNCF